MLEEEIVKLTSEIKLLREALTKEVVKVEETIPEPKTVIKPTPKQVAKAEPKTKVETKVAEITDKHLAELCSQLYSNEDPELCDFLDAELDKIFASFDAKTVTDISQERRDDFLKALMGLVGEKENFVPAKPASMTLEELVAVVREFIADTHEDLADRKAHLKSTNIKFDVAKASLVSADKVTAFHDHLVNTYAPDDDI